jgi:predicted DNA-binding transcriptional regulator YafY
MDPSTVLLSGHLTADEVVGLIVSVSLLRASPWMPFSREAERALVKIERALPPERIRSLRLLLRRVLVGSPAPDATRDLDSVAATVLVAFERAFGARFVLAFRYQNREGHASRRQVEPQALLVRAPLWYVVGWDLARDGLRLFRMDRVTNPRVLTTRTFALRNLELVAGACPDARRKTGG